MKASTIVNVLLIGVAVLLLLGALNNLIGRSRSEPQSTATPAGITVSRLAQQPTARPDLPTAAVSTRAPPKASATAVPTTATVAPTTTPDSAVQTKSVKLPYGAPRQLDCYAQDGWRIARRFDVDGGFEYHLERPVGERQLNELNQKEGLCLFLVGQRFDGGAPIPALDLPVLGGTGAAWVASKGAPTKGVIGPLFQGGIEVMFVEVPEGPRAWHVELLISGSPLPTADAKKRAQPYHPTDAQPVEVYTAPFGQTVEVFHSRALAQVFQGTEVFGKAQPGTFIQIAERGTPTTSRVVIGTGNNP